MIVATDKAWGIGFENQLLCHLPADLKYFRKTTTGHHILMGRKTFESVGRPLPNRVNLIISSGEVANSEGCKVFSSPMDAIAYAKLNGEEELFITGGGKLYRDLYDIADRLYITRIHHQFKADTHFPEPDNKWELVSEELHQSDDKNPYDYSFQIFERK